VLCNIKGGDVKVKPANQLYEQLSLYDLEIIVMVNKEERERYYLFKFSYGGKTDNTNEAIYHCSRYDLHEEFDVLEGAPKMARYVDSAMMTKIIDFLVAGDEKIQVAHTNTGSECVAYQMPTPENCTLDSDERVWAMFDDLCVCMKEK